MDVEAERITEIVASMPPLTGDTLKQIAALLAPDPLSETAEQAIAARSEIDQRASSRSTDTGAEA